MPITLNNDLSTMKVGEYVWCKYTASSGAVGTFSEFATKTDAEVIGQEIPVASTATPNGYFRFIMVEDWNGKKRLVADRNIQHSISWDTLNTSGIASGSGLPLTSISEEPTVENGFYRKIYAVRLLTGGTSSTDKDNEWDKYIVDSNLGGSITSGDNTIWNYSVGLDLRTITSTTINNDSTRRVTRSGTDSSGYFSKPTINVSSAHGFRPVIEEYENEFVIFDKTLILHNGEYKKWNQGSPASSGENIVPIMTSDTSPSGIAKASNIESDTTKAFKAFDGNLTTYWSSYPQGQAQLSYEFNSKKIIAKYSITNRSNNAYSPVDFTFEGSDNGTSWTVLDTQSNLTWNSGSETKTFNINNVTPYSTYRINVTRSANIDAVIIAEFKLFELAYPAIPSSWQSVSSTLPTVNQFVDNGMDSLTPILDRSVNNLNSQEMSLDSTFVGEGKLYRKKVDLNKYFDLRTITTETRNS